MSWVPNDDGTTTCTDHPGQSWKTDGPVTCPLCDGSVAPIEIVDSEAEILNARAEAASLGDEVDDERAFLTLSKLAHRWAKAAHNGPGHDEGGRDTTPDFEPNHKAAHSYLALASLNRWRKSELTARRRDWLRYERAARRALGIRSGSPEAVALTAAMRGAAAREVSN